MNSLWLSDCWSPLRALEDIACFLRSFFSFFLSISYYWFEFDGEVGKVWLVLPSLPTLLPILLLLSYEKSVPYYDIDCSSSMSLDKGLLLLFYSSFTTNRFLILYCLFIFYGGSLNWSPLDRFLKLLDTDLSVSPFRTFLCFSDLHLGGFTWDLVSASLTSLSIWSNKISIYFYDRVFVLLIEGWSV